KALESAGARVKAGDLGAAKSQLMAQAVALNAMFAKFADMAHHTDLVYPPRAIHAYSFARTKPVRADPRGPRRLEEPDGHRQAGERRPDPASPQWSSATGRARGPPQSCAEQTSGRGECRTRTDGARSGARRRARRFTAGSRGSRAPAPARQKERPAWPRTRIRVQRRAVRTTARCSRRDAPTSVNSGRPCSGFGGDYQ